MRTRTLFCMFYLCLCSFFGWSFAFFHRSTATYPRLKAATSRGTSNARSSHSRPAAARLQRPAPLSAVTLTREQILQLYSDEDEDEFSFFHNPGKNYRVGFMSVVGNPNAGKSTLLNAILGDKLSIVSPKPQTTRHEIVGVLTTSTHQLIVRDTPGVLQPKYALQSSMMKAVKRALSAADVYLLLADVTEPLDEMQPVSPVLVEYAQMLNKTGKPVIVGLNKIDMMARNKQQLEQHRQLWRTLLPHAEIQEVSALRGTNVQKLLDRIVAHLPEGPLLYPNNTFTDATERFYASEIIREQLFLNYKKEVPYSCEVVIDQFKDSEDLLSISATIFVARKTQVPIIVGRQGDALKKVLRSASQELQAVHGKQVSLHIDVRVAEDWNTNPLRLRHFGYDADPVTPTTPTKAAARKPPKPRQKRTRV